MIEIKNFAADVELGAFHDVEYVDLGRSGISIFSKGVETMITVRGVYDLETNDWLPIGFEHTFAGEMPEVEGFAYVDGLHLSDVVKVTIGEPTLYSTVMCRPMRVEIKGGLTFVFQLFSDLPVKVAA